MNWRPRALEDCAKFKSGGTPSKSNSAYWGGDIPWVGSGEMSQSFIYDTQLRLTAEGAENGTRAIPENTVLVVVRGMSLAKEFRIAITRKPMTFNQDVKALQCAEDIDPQFLFYALKTRKEYIRDLATEASHGTKKLETSALNAVEILVPGTIEDQRTVAAVARNYDDLIENNRRRIALLEEAARQLYKEWFVHFRFPGHEHVKLIDGVPEGWTLGRIGDFYATSSGGTPSRKVPEYFNGKINWVKSGELQGGFILQTEEKITEQAVQNSSAKLFARQTVLVAMYGATIAQLGILASDAACNQACCSLRPAHSAANFVYAYLFLEHNKERLIGLGKGSAQNNISQSIIKEFSMVMPLQQISSGFCDIVEPIFRQIENLQVQNRTLARARDLLLPKLMSGGIAV